ncbi:glycosyltransferase family 39 protein [Armatimonas sp.]|uniref:ArnT family glycosyltransferase n=1 Tax=Armatimonas sp. TaxID=1872638 RepID=UPI00286B654C|nr:glycosyltransferase family 39 protein [Armatimonas sp.]
MSASLRRYLPALVLFLALVLRVWGLAWGLPDSTHSFSYHPDESMVLGAALVHEGQSLLDTHFYNYGSLVTMTDRFVFLATGIGHATIPSASHLLMARLITVLYGVGTCALLLILGKRLKKPGVGLLAATLYATAPLAVQHGHFATVDVPATFWVTASLFCALTQPRLFLCGLFAGLAAATKYNAGLVLLAGVTAWWLSEKRTIKPLALLLSATLLGFLVGCPGMLINFPTFWQQLTAELRHSRNPDEYFVGQLAALYWPTLGLLFALASPLWVVGLGRALAVRGRTEVILLAFVLPYLLLICVSANQYTRYALPILPALCWLIGSLPRKLSPLIAIGGALSLAFSVALCSVMAGSDPRDEAAVFLKQKGVASVGFARGPWYWSPPLHPILTAPIPTAARRAANSSETLRLFAVPEGRDWDPSLLQATQPDAVALSEIEYTTAVRTKNPQALAYLAALTSRYPNKTVFAHPLPVLGARDYAGLPCQPLPIDMIYPNQAVVIFTK